MHTAAHRKISETIIDFGEPLIGQLDPGQPGEVVRSVFEIVIMVWNAHVLEMPEWGQRGLLGDLRRLLGASEMPAPMVEAFEALSRRRAERFAADGRAVGEWDIFHEAGRWRLRCDARAPDLEPDVERGSAGRTGPRAH
jgi:hypothetical protein